MKFSLPDMILRHELAHAVMALREAPEATGRVARPIRAPDFRAAVEDRASKLLAAGMQRCDLHFTI